MFPGGRQRSAELAGPIAELEFPPLCANCGHPAAQTLRVEKVFHPPSRTGNEWPEIVGAQVPFCPECVARHRREVQTFTPAERFRLCFRSGSMLGIFFYPMLGMFLFFVASRVSRDGGIVAAIGAFFALMAWPSYRRAFDETRWNAVPPLTSITSAFDFSASRPKLFDEERRVFTLRNPAFAEAFMALNHARVWDAESAPARKARTARNWVATSLLFGLGAWLLWRLGSGFLATP